MPETNEAILFVIDEKVDEDADCFEDYEIAFSGGHSDSVSSVISFTDGSNRVISASWDNSGKSLYISFNYTYIISSTMGYGNWKLCPNLFRAYKKCLFSCFNFEFSNSKWFRGPNNKVIFSLININLIRY